MSNTLESGETRTQASQAEEKVYARQALKLSGTKLFLTAFSTLGIIYSDIGTSPLYVLNGIWPAAEPAPPEDDIVGGISAVLWAIMLIPLLKYVFCALHFGTGEGEGGPFALFMGLFPKQEEEHFSRSLTTYPTQNSHLQTSSSTRLWFKKLKWPLLIWAVFGTSLTLSDGILTPAVSVTSAVGGLAVAQPSVSNDVVGISIAFLLALFLIQRFGTAKIGIVFAPVTAVWLALLGVTGIVNITTHPGIFRAFDPSRAVLWFVRTKKYDALNGVLLAITGSEAMFANLGQFNAASIRISFAGYACPMLLLAYLGQGARLLDDSDVLQNVFYRSIPGPSGGPLWWIVWIFGILATLIASQAMITANFSLIHQLMGMHAFPSLRVHHTSSVIYGQIYIAPINWVLMIATIAVVGGFGSSTALTLAYGFAVSTVLIVTTTLIAISIPIVKGYFWLLGIAFLVFFGFIEGLFWGAALKKVPHGAWFPLGVGGLLTILMVFWVWGRTHEDTFERDNTQRLSDLLAKDSARDDSTPMIGSPVQKDMDEADDRAVVPEVASKAKRVDQARIIGSRTPSPDGHSLCLRQIDGSLRPIPTVPRLTIFHGSTPTGLGVPHTFARFLQVYPALPRVVVFLSVRVVAIPHVGMDDRYVINKVRSLPGFYSVQMRTGYLDRYHQVATDIVTLIDEPMDKNDTVANVTHVIPSYDFRSDEKISNWRIIRWVRSLLIEDIYGRARVMFPDPVHFGSQEGEGLLRIALEAKI